MPCQKAPGVVDGLGLVHVRRDEVVIAGLDAGAELGGREGRRGLEAPDSSDIILLLVRGEGVPVNAPTIVSVT